MAMGTRACCLCTLHVHAPTPGTPPACVLPACAAMHACMLKLPRRQGVRVRLPSLLAEPEVRHAHASSPVSPRVAGWCGGREQEKQVRFLTPASRPIPGRDGEQ